MLSPLAAAVVFAVLALVVVASALLVHRRVLGAAVDARAHAAAVRARRMSEPAVAHAVRVPGDGMTSLGMYEPPERRAGPCPGAAVAAAPGLELRRDDGARVQVAPGTLVVIEPGLGEHRPIDGSVAYAVDLAPGMLFWLTARWSEVTPADSPYRDERTVRAEPLWHDDFYVPMIYAGARDRIPEYRDVPPPASPTFDVRWLARDLVATAMAAAALIAPPWLGVPLAGVLLVYVALSALFRWMSP